MPGPSNGSPRSKILRGEPPSPVVGQALNSFGSAPTIEQIRAKTAELAKTAGPDAAREFEEYALFYSPAVRTSGKPAGPPPPPPAPKKPDLPPPSLETQVALRSFKSPPNDIDIEGKYQEMLGTAGKAKADEFKKYARYYSPAANTIETPVEQGGGPEPTILDPDEAYLRSKAQPKVAPVKKPAPAPQPSATPSDVESMIKERLQQIRNTQAPRQGTSVRSGITGKPQEIIIKKTADNSGDDDYDKQYAADHPDDEPSLLERAKGFLGLQKLRDEINDDVGLARENTELKNDFEHPLRRDISL